MAEQMYGVQLISVKRYHFRGKMYELGKQYAVNREMRDHFVNSGYFKDTLIDDEPQPIKLGGASEPIETGGEAPGKPGGKGGPPRIPRQKVSDKAVTV